MAPGEPKWRRRKDARPGEIVEAAVEVFSEKGFAAARLEDIAARAGVSKGALYLYFETKQDLFRAVIRDAVAPNIVAVEAVVGAADAPFAELSRMLFARVAELLDSTQIGAVAKMVIAESGNFPDLARVWHDDVISRVLGLMTGLISQAQARGEVRPGDPRIHALSLIGPLFMGVMWREVMVPIGVAPFDLAEIGRQHADTVLEGLLA